MFVKNRYGRIPIPMITPFKQNQEIDYDAAVRTAEKLTENEYADSLTLTGAAGEFFHMTAEEKIKPFKANKDSAGNALPVIAGGDSASACVLVCTIPVFTGVNADPDTLARLSVIHNIDGVPDTHGAGRTARRMLPHRPYGPH